MTMTFDKNDYVQLKDGENYINKFVILRLNFFKEEYREAKNQLFYATGGFGCYPEKIGGKVFGRWFDEWGQTRREYILGVATEEAIANWEKTYGISREVFKKDEEDAD